MPYLHILTPLRPEARVAPLLLQVALSLVMNWVVGPALMTGLAWATLPDLEGYRNGVILVGTNPLS